MKKIIILPLSLCTRDAYKQTFSYNLVNTSRAGITFLIPFHNILWDKRPNFDSITQPYDTTIATYGPLFWNSGGAVYLDASSTLVFHSGFNSLEEIMLLDTLRLFVYEQKTIQGESLDEYFENIHLLQRYDLSLNDLKQLINVNKELEIHWPPDPRMVGMKMWPPYGYYTYDRHPVPDQGSIQFTVNSLEDIVISGNSDAK